tara:strand:+ start:587 stop:841 length:255 start_codon:yes stop_codon:yes gene_type:complete
MKIVAWKLVAFDENDNEISVEPSNSVARYRVSFMPHETLQYDYVVEAKNEDEAQDKAKEQLMWAIGSDGAKDWECSNIEESEDE